MIRYYIAILAIWLNEYIGNTHIRICFSSPQSRKKQRDKWLNEPFDGKLLELISTRFIGNALSISDLYYDCKQKQKTKTSQTRLSNRNVFQ